MKTTRRLLSLIVCVLMLMGSVLPVHAADSRMSHGITAHCLFAITDTGLSELSITYSANTTSFTHITIESYIQKRSLGFIWTKVDNGETDKTWVDYSTATDGIFIHQLQLSETGKYRAVYTITFSGTGAEDDVIEDKLEYTYE